MTVESRQAFQRDLDRVRAAVVRLAAVVSETIPRGTEALLGMDLDGAHRVIADDDVADALTIVIEEQCDQLLTLQQPVASDLREVVTALRIAAELERSADLMVNVAKGTRRIYGVILNPRLSGLIELMGEEASRLVRRAIDAYDERDASLAGSLHDQDDRLDELSAAFIHAVFDAHYSGAGLALRAGVQLALIGRYYERIGDHAVNIAEQVQFLVTGARSVPVGVADVAEATGRSWP